MLRQLGLSVSVILLAGCARIAPVATPESMPFDLQGHRGARGLAPENTIPAFQRALGLGVTTLELDVVISSDGKVVVSHEPWMNDTICSLPSGEPIPGGEGREHNIFALTYAEIARYDCGLRGNPRFPEQTKQPATKPLLRDVIALAEAYSAENYPSSAPVRYNIETKSQPESDGLFHPEPERFTQLLYAVVSEAGVVSRASIQSFDPRTLTVARRLDPTWPTVLLVEYDSGMSMEEHVERLGFAPVVYSPNARLVDASLVARVRERGMLLIPWTVNDSADMNRLIDLGVDGLISDYPNRATEVLASRGIAWR